VTGPPIIITTCLLSALHLYHAMRGPAQACAGRVPPRSSRLAVPRAFVGSLLSEPRSSCLRELDHIRATLLVLSWARAHQSHAPRAPCLIGTQARISAGQHARRTSLLVLDGNTACFRPCIFTTRLQRSREARLSRPSLSGAAVDNVPRSIRYHLTARAPPGSRASTPLVLHASWARKPPGRRSHGAPSSQHAYHVSQRYYRLLPLGVAM
jgi:hypothetical protein